MVGYANRFRNGVETRTVFYNGAYWNTHRACNPPSVTRWYSVQRISNRYPRVYGVRTRTIAGR